MKAVIRQIIVLSLACLASHAGSAQDASLDLRLPVEIFAENSTFDGKTGTYIYRGLQLKQGTISIEAEEGRATARGQDEGEWRFSGDVTIVVDNGRIECESAHLVFEDSILMRATVTGEPATFELLRSNANDATRASAGRLDYDVRNGVIEFSDDAMISEAGNEIASHLLLYNINERRIDADSSGDGDDRVRILYTPTNGDSNGDEEETPTEDAGTQ